MSLSTLFFLLGVVFIALLMGWRSRKETAMHNSKMNTWLSLTPPDVVKAFEILSAPYNVSLDELGVIFQKQQKNIQEAFDEAFKNEAHHKERIAINQDYADAIKELNEAVDTVRAYLLQQTPA